MKPLSDAFGTEIQLGDVVRQAKVHDPGRGALYGNAGQSGTVVGWGRTRIKVDFGRTKLESFGRVATSEPIIDSVHASLLTVIRS